MLLSNLPTYNRLDLPGDAGWASMHRVPCCCSSDPAETSWISQDEDAGNPRWLVDSPVRWEYHCTSSR